MKQIFLVGAMFIAATFLITNIPNTTMAYTCSSTSSTHNTKSQTGVSGISGSCSSSSSSTSAPRPNGSAKFSASGPPGTSGLTATFCGTPSCSATASGQTAAGASAIKSNPSVITGNYVDNPGLVTGTGTVSGSPSGVQSTSSSSSGGAQSSCSSSSSTSVGGATTASNSQSQPGSCP